MWDLLVTAGQYNAVVFPPGVFEVSRCRVLVIPIRANPVFDALKKKKQTLTRRTVGRWNKINVRMPQKF